VLAEGDWKWARVMTEPSEMTRFLERPLTLQYLGCNWHQDVFWFNREAFLYLTLCLALAGTTEVPAGREFPLQRARVRVLGNASALTRLAEQSGYDYHLFMELLSQSWPRPAVSDPKGDRR
jgi:hypothetical protein